MVEADRRYKGVADSTVFASNRERSPSPTQKVLPYVLAILRSCDKELPCEFAVVINASRCSVGLTRCRGVNLGGTSVSLCDAVSIKLLPQRPQKAMIIPVCADVEVQFVEWRAISDLHAVAGSKIAHTNWFRFDKVDQPNIVTYLALHDGRHIV